MVGPALKRSIGLKTMDRELMTQGEKQGTDTVTSTVELGNGRVLHNPDMLCSKAKRRVREAYRKKENLVEESDIAKLPYLQAIVKETFRLHPAVPLLLPRKAEVEFEMHGYTIPKGAQVLINVWAIGRDPNLWEKPRLFWPERFLESEIDFKGSVLSLPIWWWEENMPWFAIGHKVGVLDVGIVHQFLDWELQDIQPE
ncbi:cytochrome P450 76T24-like, partial [Vigna umbellata]|uniref:cytochrome P450 76T24-like n=1 Tax=Vigna umbellata TaxID=87088 RepID=UPI001F5FD01C